MQLRNISLALERIQYQNESPLFKKLVAAIDDAYAWVLKTRPSIAGDVTPADDTRGGMIATEFKRPGGFYERVGKIVKEELNLTVTKIWAGWDEGDVYIYPNAFVIPGYVDVKDRDTYAPHLLSTGAGNTPVSDAIKAVLVKVAEGVDLNTGRFSNEAAKIYSIQLGIPPGLFMLEETTVNIADMTSPEIAAILLHELGHAVTLGLGYANTYRKATAIKDCFDFLKNNKKPVTKQDVQAIVDVISKNISPEDADYGRMSAGVGKLQNWLKKNASDPYASFNTGYMIMIVFVFLLSSLLNTFYDSARSSLKRKGSDDAGTILNNTYYERVADEFSARHGATAPLLSAMLKIYKLNEIGIFGAKSNKPGKIYSTLINWTQIYKMIGNIISPKVFLITSCYDVDMLRLEKMIQNNMSIFKDPLLPKDVRARWLLETQTALNTYREYRSQRYVKIREFIWSTVLRADKPGTLGGILVDGNLAADYDKVQNLTAGLIRNPLYYQAAKIQDRAGV